jgi:hypothetical protein
MQIIKRFRDRIEEVLGVRFNPRMTDLEYRKHGKPISHFDSLAGEGQVTFHDAMDMGKTNPTYTGVVEAIDRPLFDTTFIVSGTTTGQLIFTAPQGTNAKSPLDTNLTQSRSLPSPESFTIKRIGYQIQTTSLLDMGKIQNLILQSFYANQKLYSQAPLVYYPVGFGVFGSTTESNISAITSGLPGEDGVRSLVYDIPLNPLDPFYAQLDVYGSGSSAAHTIGTLTLTTTTTQIVCYLQGPYQRAI